MLGMRIEVDEVEMLQYALYSQRKDYKDTACKIPLKRFKVLVQSVLEGKWDFIPPILITVSDFKEQQDEGFCVYLCVYLDIAIQVHSCN